MTGSEQGRQESAANTTEGCIRLKTSMLVPGLHSEDLALSPELATMDALLRDIGRRTGLALIKPDGDLIDFIDVRLNGTAIAFHPHGLGARLKPGDSVLVRLVPIGGG